MRNARPAPPVPLCAMPGCGDRAGVTCPDCFVLFCFAHARTHEHPPNLVALGELRLRRHLAASQPDAPTEHAAHP